MKSSDFARQFRDQLRQLSIDGRKTLETNNVAAFLDEKIPALVEAEKSHENIVVDFQVEHYKFQLSSQTKLFESVIEYGKHALNASLVVNAGAAVSLLSFIGAQSTKLPATSERMATPMIVFVIGVFLAALASGGAYCSQYFYAHSPESDTGPTFHRTTVGVLLGSYVCFVAGGYLAYSALSARLG